MEKTHGWVEKDGHWMALECLINHDTCHMGTSALVVELNMKFHIKHTLTFNTACMWIMMIKLQLVNTQLNNLAAHMIIPMDTLRQQGDEWYILMQQGHSGFPITKDILMSQCNIDDAVKMTTGYVTDKDHPLKSTYGNNDVEGKETCGIRASGTICRDGQCHQIINRLMHIGHSNTSFDMLWNSDKCPGWYGLSRYAFGPYVYRFDDWCHKNQYVLPLSDTQNSVYDWIRQWVRDDRFSRKVFYHVTDYRNTCEAPNSDPFGPAITKLQ